MAAEAAPLLAACAELAFRESCVPSKTAETPGCCSLFLELPQAVAAMTVKMLGMTAERPPEQRFKPIMTRLRALQAGDIEAARALITAAQCDML